MPSTPERHRWRLTDIPLQWRLSLGALAALLLGMASLLALLQAAAYRGLLASSQQRAQLVADRTAEIIDKRVVDMRRAAQLVAGEMNEPLLQDPQALQAFMASKPIFRSMFANTFVASSDGQVLLVADDSGVRRPPQSIADRPYFQRMLREQRGVVSEPVLGRISAEPVLVFAQPLIRDGRVYGAVGGALRLASRDLLADMAHARSAGIGMTLITDAAGTVLAHPQRAALTRPLAEVEGFAVPIDLGPGARVQRSNWVDADRASELVVTGTVASTGWLVWRVLTREELLAPLRPAQREALIVSLVLALVLSGGLLWFLRRQFRPLTWLSDNAPALARGEITLDSTFQGDASETGRLARTIERALAERGEAERQSLATQNRLAVVLAASPVGIAFTRNQHFEMVNDETARILGWPVMALVGRHAKDIYASPEYYDELGPKVAKAFAETGTFDAEVQMRHASGRPLWARLQGRPADRGDPSAGTIWSFHDIDVDVAARRKLEHAAMHDALTGLANREAFNQRLQEVYETSEGQHNAAVLMLDLDHFKPLNDTEGHAAGDAMLQAVARELLKPVRGNDVVARLGGDEFAVVLAECDADNAQLIAERLRQVIQRLSVPWNGRSLRVGVTVGLASRDATQTDAQSWLVQADLALYEAKRQQRGSLAIADGIARAGAAVLPFARPGV